METIEYNGKLFKRYGKYFRIGNLYLHRVVWTDHNGPVPANHHIHHIDHDQANNAIENLAIMTRSEHQRHHIAETRKNKFPNKCDVCGNDFMSSRPTYERFCSKPCQDKFHHPLVVPKNSVNCVYCSKSFVRMQRNQIFCSRHCKDKNHQKNLREATKRRKYLKSLTQPNG